jgi:hypothetical protein
VPFQQLTPEAAKLAEQVQVHHDSEEEEPKEEDDSNGISVDGVDEAEVVNHDIAFEQKSQDISRLEKKSKCVNISAFIFAVLAMTCALWSNGTIATLLLRILVDEDVDDGAAGNVDRLSCFFSSSGDEYDCPDGNGKPCPPGALCEFGELKKCPWFQDINATSGGCDLIAGYRDEMVTPLEKDLIRHYKEHQSCDEENVPLFPYAVLKEKNPNLYGESASVAEILMSEGFAVEWSEDGLKVGLPEAKRPGTPFSCFASKSVKWALGAIGTLMWDAACLTFFGAFSIASAYPMAMFIGFLVVAFLTWLSKRRNYARQLKLDTANVRQLAYEILQGSPQNVHVVLHVRDEIVLSLYPESRKDRDNLIHKVWPKVTHDLKQDNRVRKSRKLIDGNLRDCWQWAAATPSNSSVRFEK